MSISTSQPDHEALSGQSKKISRNFTSRQFTRKPLIAEILKRWFLVGKKVPYKFPNDIASKLSTLHGVSRRFVCQPKNGKFSNGHSSETRCVKKKKKRVLQISYSYTPVPIYGSKLRNLGGQKNSTKIFGSGTFGLEARQMPPGCRTSPKMVPPYSLGTCPPKTPRTL